MASDTTQRNQHGDQSVAELVSQASQQVSQLIRDEFRLARAEMTDKGRRLGVGGGLFGAAGLTAVLAVQALLAAAVAGLATVLSVWASALIVGGAMLVIAAILAVAGRRQMAAAVPLVPEQTIDSLKTDVAEIKKDAHR